MSGELQFIEVNAESCGKIALLVEIDCKSTVTRSGKTDSQIESNGRFAASSLGIGKRKHMRHLIPPINRSLAG
jgi:hypothetical protein